MTKLLIIGLDGATFRVIDPLISEGRLPNIARILKEGTRATLQSTIPPASSPGWDAFITGKNPGKLGIFDVFHRKPGSYDLTRPNATHRKGVSFWNLIKEKSIILNIPMTFPPEKVNGILISGRGATEDSDYTYPPEIKQELNTICDGYIITPDYHFTIDNLHLTLDKRMKAIHHLMKKEWQLFVVNFLATDVVGHGFWGTGEVENIYQKMDRIIGEMIQVAGDAHVIIMSDHGNGPPSQVFWPNTWLQKEGFLVTHPPSTKQRLRGVAMHQKVRIRNVLESLGILNIAYRLTPKRVTRAIPSRGPTITDGNVDWEQTVAYSIYGNMPRIFINLKGREPNGSVSVEQYETIRDTIITRLKELTHPDIISVQIYKKEEIYHGPHMDEAPDILIQFNNFGSAYMQASLNNNKVITSMKPNFAWHTPDGIFMMTGPGVKKGATVPDLNIMDIAPLVLHLFQSPIPRDMDGRLRRDLFDPTTSIATREPQYTDAQEKTQTPTESLTPEQEEKILKQLKSMGYS